MKKKRLIYILEFVRNELINDETNHHEDGICAVIYYLRVNKFISIEEANELTSFLYDRKPTNKNQYAEFMDNKYWCNNLCWWTRIMNAPETRQIRIDYLNKLIENTK